MIGGAGHLGSSISALVKEFEVLSHNLANVNTVGFKKTANSFSKEMMNQMDTGPEGMLEATDIKADDYIDFTQGNLTRTERVLDLAIMGKGFFTIETPDGPLYTRNGVFNVNNKGQLVDTDGNLVGGVDGPIVVPETISQSQINITEDGLIQADGKELGKLKLVDFGTDEDKLVPIGNSRYVADKNITVNDARSAAVKQGYQEKSNVNLMDELVDMMTVSRLYEANMKLLAKKSDTSQSMIDVANG